VSPVFSMNLKKKVALCLAALLLAMTCVFVAVPAPSASAQTPVSGTFTLGNATGTGTYDPVTGETVTGDFTAACSISGDVSGIATFTATYNTADQLWHATAASSPATLALDGVTHPAMFYGAGTTSNFEIQSPGPPGPCTVTFDFAISLRVWTTDGSNIFAYGAAVGSGNCTQVWDSAQGQWEMTDHSASASWTGSALNLATAPQADDIAPGSGTVTLSDVEGTIGKLDYTTTGSGTILLAQYESNPGDTPPKLTLGKYLEVSSNVISPEITWPVELRVYYTDAEVSDAGIDESSLRMYSWNGSNWVVVADSGVNALENYVWARVYSLSPHSPMGDAPDNTLGAEGGRAMGGVANWMAYIISFLEEMAGHLFDVDSGGFTWQKVNYEWYLVDREVPEMTEMGKNAVGSLMTIVENYLVFLAQMSTLLPAQSVSS